MDSKQHADIMQALGQLNGKMDMVVARQQKDHDRLNDIDKRSTKNAAVSGTVASVGVTLLLATFKDKLGI